MIDRKDRGIHKHDGKGLRTTTVVIALLAVVSCAAAVVGEG